MVRELHTKMRNSKAKVANHGIGRGRESRHMIQDCN